MYCCGVGGRGDEVDVDVDSEGNRTRVTKPAKRATLWVMIDVEGAKDEGEAVDSVGEVVVEVLVFDGTNAPVD